jgi:hypothetical protein
MPSRLPSRGISLHSSINSKRKRSEGRNLHIHLLLFHSDERNRKTGSSLLLSTARRGAFLRALGTPPGGRLLLPFRALFRALQQPKNL